MLLDDGSVYGCGINEKGTIPAEGVEPEGSTDKLTPIKFDSSLVQRHGKVCAFIIVEIFTDSCLLQWFFKYAGLFVKTVTLIKIACRRKCNQIKRREQITRKGD